MFFIYNISNSFLFFYSIESLDGYQGGMNNLKKKNHQLLVNKFQLNFFPQYLRYLCSYFQNHQIITTLEVAVGNVLTLYNFYNNTNAFYIYMDDHFQIRDECSAITSESVCQKYTTSNTDDLSEYNSVQL